MRNHQVSSGGLVMRNTVVFEVVKNPLLLISRLLMMVLFINFGLQKLLDYGGTAGYFVQQGVPLPYVATPIAIAILEHGRRRSTRSRDKFLQEHQHHVRSVCNRGKTTGTGMPCAPECQKPGNKMLGFAPINRGGGVL